MWNLGEADQCRNRRCKGPEAEVSLVCSRNSSVAAEEAIGEQRAECQPPQGTGGFQQLSDVIPLRFQ